MRLLGGLRFLHLLWNGERLGYGARGDGHWQNT